MPDTYFAVYTGFPFRPGGRNIPAYFSPFALYFGSPGCYSFLTVID